MSETISYIDPFDLCWTKRSRGGKLMACPACPCWQRAVERYFNPRQPSGLIFMFDKNGKKHKGMKLRYRHASCLHRAAFAYSMILCCHMLSPMASTRQVLGVFGPGQSAMDNLHGHLQREGHAIQCLRKLGWPETHGIPRQKHIRNNQFTSNCRFYVVIHYAAMPCLLPLHGSFVWTSQDMRATATFIWNIMSPFAAWVVKVVKLVMDELSKSRLGNAKNQLRFAPSRTKDFILWLLGWI